MENGSDRRVWAGHVVPFFVWVGVLLLLQGIEVFSFCPRWIYPWSYAVKSGACALLFLTLKPWRVYPAFQVRHLGVSLAVGLMVAAVWIVPETPWLARWFPDAQVFYHRWLILMPGVLPDYFDPAVFPGLPVGSRSLAYAPEEAGWGLTLAKVLGSACVVAVIEEFFFRGFFYRWLQKVRFWTVPLNVFDRSSFWTVAAVFALEHDRWAVGLIAGLAYGWLAVRTGHVWAAAIAHGTTNLLLGVYVVLSRQYGFW